MLFTYMSVLQDWWSCTNFWKC